MDSETNSTTSQTEKRQSPAGVIADVADRLDDSAALDQTILASDEPSDQVSIREARPRLSKRRIFGLTMLGVGVLAIAALLLKSSLISQQQNVLNTGEQIKPQSFALPELSQQLTALSPQSNDALRVNGQLDAEGSLVLAPTTKPTNAVAGQIYYDNKSNQLSYYNGKKFITPQSGGNTFVTNNNITNIAGATTNVTKVTNVTNVNGGGGGATGTSGTAGHVAMFTAANALGNSLITQNGNTLTTGSGVENVTLGSGAGASATTLQGGTSGVSLLTGSAAGSSGAINIQSGDISTTSAGDVSVDTGVSTVNGLVVADYGFEDGIDGGFFENFIGNYTLTQDCTVSHSGSCSMDMTGSDPSGGGNLVISEQGSVDEFPVTPGHHYVISFWVKAAGTGAPIVGQTQDTPACVYSPQVSDNSSSWTHIEWTCTAQAGATDMGLDLGFQSATVETHYFDDITVTDISSSSSTAALNLGATNAQSVTIGNIDETGLTSILGSSGISINSGVGDIDVTGGALSITGNSTSNITVNGGPLNISAGGDSTWGIANSSGAGGSLTINSGNAGGNSNGGDLDLQAGSAAGTGVGGNINILTAGNTGASGAITLQSGDSSQTAAGNVTIDTGAGFVSGTIVDDRDFESSTNHMTSWFGDTVAQSSAQAHDGLESLAETATATNWGVTNDQNFSSAPAVPGHHYFFSAWVRAATTPEIIHATIGWGGAGSTLTLASVTDSTSGWTQITGSGVAPAGSTQAYWQLAGLGAIGEVHYFDDLVVTDLSSSSATSELDVGATNAQIVTIGNANEIGTTTINGGSGISLNAGSANIDVSGGAINIAGSGASALSTSNGALNITSAAAATWKVGAAGSGTGGNLTIQGGTAGFGSNNGGNLILQGGLATGTGTGGSVIVKPQTDSTAAFQIQNSAGTATLFNADTSNMIVTVAGTTSAFGALALSNAHFASSQTTPPTINTTTCVGAPTVTAGSTDSAGSFSTGTLTAGGSCVITVTFNQPYATAPKSVMLTPMNSSAADTSAAGPQPFVSNTTTNSFEVTFNTSVSTGTNYAYYYWVIE